VLEVRRIAVVSDIHGVVGALDAVLDAAGEAGCSEVWCLGDNVGHPGGNPLECIQIVEERCSIVVKGNHDAGLSGEVPLSDVAGIPAAKRALERIQAELADHPKRDQIRTYLRGLPLEVELETPRGPMLIVHASPLNQLWHDVRGAGDYWHAFSAAPQALLVLGGHTHRPSYCVRTTDGKLDHGSPADRMSDGIEIDPEAWTFANPGSVGAPASPERDAEWAILTIDASGAPTRIEWRKTAVPNRAGSPQTRQA
jgi:predicted phosphodiesterase